MNVYVHPKWIERAGAGDIERHFQLRGFAVWVVPGSRFFHVEPLASR